MVVTALAAACAGSTTTLAEYCSPVEEATCRIWVEGDLNKTAFAASKSAVWGEEMSLVQRDTLIFGFLRGGAARLSIAGDMVSGTHDGGLISMAMARRPRYTVVRGVRYGGLGLLLIRDDGSLEGDVVGQQDMRVYLDCLTRQRDCGICNLHRRPELAVVFYLWLLGS